VPGRRSNKEGGAHAPKRPRPQLAPQLGPSLPLGHTFSASSFHRRLWGGDTASAGCRVQYSRPGGRPWSNQGNRTAPCRREDRVYRQRIVPRARVDAGAAVRRRSRHPCLPPVLLQTVRCFLAGPLLCGAAVEDGQERKAYVPPYPSGTKAPRHSAGVSALEGLFDCPSSGTFSYLVRCSTLQHGGTAPTQTGRRPDACPTRSPQHKIARAGRGHHRCAALAVGDATKCSVPGPSSPSCPHHAGHNKLCRGGRRRSRGASAEDGSCVLMAVADQQQAFLHWGLHRGGLDRGWLEAALYPMRSVDERLCSGRAIAEPC
jgi:hypothetical protein